MKKILVTFFTLLLAVSCIFAVACGNNPSDKDITGVTFADATFDYDGTEKTITVTGIVPQGVTVKYSNNSATEVGEYNATATLSGTGYKQLTLSAKLTIINSVPTATQFVAARKSSTESSIIGYDFKLSLATKVSVSKFSGTANAIYDGKYRYDKSAQKTDFMRKTSGLLLYDSTEYIYTKNSTKILLKTDETGEVKKLSTLPAQDEELTLINLPFVKIIDSLEANNLADIKLSGDSVYKYSATVNLKSDNALLNKAFGLLGKLGTNINIKQVSFTNPGGGFPILFNIVNGKLDDFKISFDLSFSVKAIKTALTLTYEQKGNTSALTIPSVDNFTTTSSGISSLISTINSAISSVKTSTAYSLDVTAKNQFDPGWTITATTDTYKARLYKNTYSIKEAPFTAFNHSYEYKTHHEEDGKETYKYTIGNIDDGTTHIVSRKGTNTVTAKSGVSANTQFDYLTNPFVLKATDVDCIKTVDKGDTTTYYLSLNATEAVNVQEKINAYINSNDAQGVIKVNNYFNSENNTIKSAIMAVTIVGGKLKKIETKTEIKYFPTGGDYTDSNITLTDTLSLTVNDKLSNAQDYEAPSGTGTFIGLGAAKYYIL